jgi:voltage-gated potassium channel
MERMAILLLRKVLLPLVCLGLVFLVAIVGFVYLEGISAVKAVYWVLEHAAITHHGVSPITEAFAIFVFVALILTYLWIGQSVISFFFGGRIREVLKRMSIDRRIERLKDHFILCGYGKLSQLLVERLRKGDLPFVVIEKNIQTFTKLIRSDVLCVHGDFRLPSILHAAGIERAKALCAVIDDDDKNTHVTMLARKLNKKLKIFTRLGDPLYEELAKKAGADEIIVPERLSAVKLYDEMVKI